MGRKKVEVEEQQTQEVKYTINELFCLIDDYGIDKAELSKLKSKTDAQNADIKTMLKALITADENGKRSYSGEQYTVTLSTTDKSVMNEEKLISWLKKNKLTKGIVKKKEYVDSSALESAIYNGLITQEQVVDMEVCKDVSISETLRVSKKKKGDK